MYYGIILISHIYIHIHTTIIYMILVGVFFRCVEPYYGSGCTGNVNSVSVCYSFDDPIISIPSATTTVADLTTVFTVSQISIYSYT